MERSPLYLLSRPVDPSPRVGVDVDQNQTFHQIRVGQLEEGQEEEEGQEKVFSRQNRRRDDVKER